MLLALTAPLARLDGTGPSYPYTENQNVAAEGQYSPQGSIASALITGGN